MWRNSIKNAFDSLLVKRIRYPKISSDQNFITTKDNSYLNFVSNDYLGLSSNQLLKDTFIAATNKYGIGSTGAATLSGFSIEEKNLREHLAAWLGFEKALTFTSGYQLNIGIYKQLIALAKTSNNNYPITIWLDKKCHASHIDGISLSKGRFSTFDETTIDLTIDKIKDQEQSLHIILTEGIFSMDGSSTYLDKLIKLKQENILGNIMLIVDDAHGIGTLGNNGKGFCSNYDMCQIDLLIGTLGKSFATHGGFICGNVDTIDYLEQTVRSHIYTTCLPPALYAASNQSLSIIKSVIGDNLRLDLENNIKYFLATAQKHNLPIYNPKTNFSPIQLLVFEQQILVEEVYASLLQNDIMVGKMLYPTVAINEPKIRISITATHTFQQIEYLCQQLAKIIQRTQVGADHNHSYPENIYRVLNSDIDNSNATGHPKTDINTSYGKIII